MKPIKEKLINIADELLDISASLKIDIDNKYQYSGHINAQDFARVNQVHNLSIAISKIAHELPGEPEDKIDEN